MLPVQKANLEIKIVTAPYFLATKIEAFYGRGKNNFELSSDMEDIIAVIDGRQELVSEIGNAEKGLKKFISESFLSFLSEVQFHDSIEMQFSHLPRNQNRYHLIIERINQIINY